MTFSSPLLKLSIILVYLFPTFFTLYIDWCKLGLIRDTESLEKKKKGLVSMETGVPCRWGAKHENHASNKLIKAEILFYRLIRFFSDDGLAGSKRQLCNSFTAVICPEFLIIHIIPLGISLVLAEDGQSSLLLELNCFRVTQ